MGGEGAPVLPIWRVSGAGVPAGPWWAGVGVHPAKLPHMDTSWGGFPWLAEAEPGPALEGEVSQG